VPLNALTGHIIDSAYRVHTTLGPGLLESIYESALAHQLTKREIPHQRQHPIPAIYDGIPLQPAFYADLLVANEVIVEIKSTESIAPVHKRQLLTYLRLANKSVGLLINFNVYLIKDGITCIINS
jgi:GxxExxY protein